MSLLVPKAKFSRYLREIFDAIKREIEAAKPKVPAGKGAPPQATLEVLTCVKLMFKNYGEEFNQDFDMVSFTNDLFYFGFNKQLIETLTELAKICKAKYKGITQIKLLNSISIILTFKTSHFPLGLDNLKKPSKQGGGGNPGDSVVERHRKESDSVTGERKQSMDTQSMAFGEGEEMKESLMLESMEDGGGSKYIKDRKDMRASQTGLVIDIPTLKKLLNKQSCEFILGLIQGTVVGAGGSASLQQ